MDITSSSLGERMFRVNYMGSEGTRQNWTFYDAESPTLHLDDSIRVAKNKILAQIPQISYKEIYLFSASSATYSAEKIYQSIVPSGENITRDKWEQVAKNLGVPLPPPSENLGFKEFEAWILENRDSMRVMAPVGQRFEHDYPLLFAANPYNITMVLPQHKKTPLFSFENSLLLNFLGSDPENEYDIYFCTAEDVLTYTENQGFPSDYVLRMYFPFLYKDGIRSLANLREKRQQLLDDYRTTLTDTARKLYETVDLFYAIQHEAGEPLPYLSAGITSFKMILHTDFIKVLPLDTIFKKIHATPRIPFIKYNPGFRRENVYRLYSNKIATNGKKIPILSLSEISKLSKETGRTGQISLYIQDTYRDHPLQVFLNFNRDGKIQLKTGLKTPISVGDVKGLVVQIIGPVIDELNTFLFETGYQIDPVNTANMDIEQIQYTSSILIEKKMDIKKYRGCLSSIFDVEEFDTTAEMGAKLKFKRVENYQEMDPISLSISRTYTKTREVEEVIRELIEEFNITEDAAKERVVKFFGEHTLIQGKLVDNAGFPVTFKVTPADHRLDITVDQIPSLQYVDIVSGYLDSIVRIFQVPGSTPAVEQFAINCKKTTNYAHVDKTTFDNIVAAEVDALPRIAQPILFMSEDADTEFFGELPPETDMGEEAEDEEDVNESDFDFDDNAAPTTTITQKTKPDDSDEESVFGMDVEGGANPDDNDEGFEINVEGKSLKNPNPFQEKMEKYDPVLILKKERGQYNPYSKICPVAVQRQPVLLTSSEKNRIDAEHPGSYSTAVQYGSEPDKQYWYICPRYWSLKHNTSMTADEVAEILKTDPNALISPKAKVVPKGAYIYEFNAPKEHLDEKGNYITHYPGLIKGKHPDGFSLPCCFKRVQVQEKETNPAKMTTKINVYVMSANSRPLPENRFGFLPDALQRFLKTDNNQCVEKTNAALIKANVSCILRYGVEQSETQSFLGCLADLYADLHALEKKPPVAEMRRILSDSITLDLFLQYHNGSLVAIFRKEGEKEVSVTNIKKKAVQYPDSWFVQEILNGGSNDELLFLSETLASFEAFKHYILDETAYIDHTYLWDVVTQANPSMIPTGMNMVILTLPKPKQVEIVCPTSAYLPKAFDPSKPTWVLFKDGDFFEPIYVYENRKKIVIHKLFRSGDADPTMNNILKLIDNTMNTHCKPQNSLPGIYTFKRNLSAAKMYDLLQSLQYTVVLQVMNYQSKIVGMVVADAENATRFFVPCAPSTLIDQVDLVLIDQVKDWKDYATTVRLLNQLYVASEGKIKCSPKMKIVDDDNIIGIVTETDQYVRISPSTPKVDDALEEMSGVDYLEADKVIIGTVAPNNQRVRTIRNIHLESRFYRVFRTMVRELLGQYENRLYKLQIVDMLENLAYSYIQKMGKIETILRKMVDTAIEFRSMSEDTTDYLADDAHFMDYTRCKKCENRNVCKLGEDGQCHLFLPERHLVMGMRNDELYYARLTDELLRFRRVRLFMLEPMYYLNLTNVDYKINDDEILLLETFLKSENFSDLRLFNFNEYLREITYDIADVAK